MADYERGYVAISRGLWDDPEFDDKAPFTRREAWIWLIAEAAWKDRKVSRDGKLIELQRGQLAHSVRFLAEAWGWGKNKVHTFLGLLKKRGNVRYDTGTGVSVITICKYDDFQSVGVDGGTTSGQATGQRRDSDGTNHNQDNQVNNNTPFIPQDDDDPGEPAKRRTRIPASFPDREAMDAACAYWRKKGRAYLCDRVNTEADKFRAHHEGKGTRAASWQSTWKTWYCNQVSFEERRGVPAGRPTGDIPTGPATFDPELAALERWKKTGEWVGVHMGPPPDHRRCKISPEKLRAAGIEPPTNQMRLAVNG